MKTRILIALLVAVSMLQAQNGLDFDGIDDHVTTPFGGPIGAANRTIECWIKTSSVTATQQVILDYGAMAPLGSRFTLNLINGGLLRIEVGGNGLNSTQSIADGNWHHVAITYDDNAIARFSMFIDGQQAAWTSAFSANTVSTGIFIGQRNDGVNHFQGVIDEVRVWNVVRTQNEINTYQNLEFCTLPTGLIVYYKFNQGAAGGSNTGITSLVSETGGNTGTLNNFTLSGTTSNWVSGAALTSAGPVIQDTTTACDSLVSPSGNYVWTTSGVHYDTLSASVGCDTIVEVDVTIIIVDTSVTVLPHSLQSNMLGANYQWLDCDNNYAVIPGETQNAFTPQTAGNFAVRVELGACIDTSRCNWVDPTFGQLELGISEIQIYPMPLLEGQRLNLKIPVSQIYHYTLLSVTGEIVSNGDLKNSSTHYELPLDLRSGVYLLKVDGDGLSQTIKLIVK